MTSEAVVNQHLRGETLRENPAERSVRAQLVGRGLIALIPATQSEIDITALSGQL